ncbi:unnamed protein product [Rotaria sp. Silwood2]|nr:unnamed protein product [Rotaria sp. Silwood2]CAF4045105.1 unnamed protein product [Rotaria sp. Silwood2]
MGNESSHHNNNYLNDYGGDRQNHRHQQTRCYTCRGFGTIDAEDTCHLCQHRDKTWSHYSSGCSCSGYGRRSATKRCDDCFGKGYR